VLEELGRVLNSPDFRGSRRGQAVLRYLVDNALADGSDPVKERTVGVELFSREPDYDTGHDAIVRVAVNDVRKRLADHYAGRLAAGDIPAIRITMQPGSYVPAFQVTHGAGAHGNQTAEVVAKAESTPLFVHRRFLYIGLLISLAALCVPVAGHSRKPWAAPEARVWASTLPWSMLTSSDHRIAVIIGDLSFSTVRAGLDVDVPLRDYADRSWIEKLSLENPAAWAFGRVSLTGVSDAVAVSKIARMLERVGYSEEVRSPRSVQMSDLGGGEPLVLVGSQHTVPWVEPFSDRLNFQIEYDRAVGRQFCRNAAPAAGETARYVPTAVAGSARTAYGVISLVPNLSHGAYVLVLGGTDRQSEEAVVQLVTDFPRFAKALSARGIHPARRVEQLELLLRLQQMPSGPEQFEIIAHRVRPL
jgi:hypothetical protein